MNTLVVGDLHGDIEKTRKALEFDGNVIFVGDFLDSFEYSVDDQIKTLCAVLDACEDDPHRVQSCIGNHELSYLEPGMRCSGFRGATHAHVIHLEARMRKLLQKYIWHKDWLISHAGVSNTLLRGNNIILDEYLRMGQFSDIGRARGGWAPCGGLHWCDWFQEFEPIPRVNQIVGHSSYRPSAPHPVTKQYTEREGIICKTSPSSINYNIDCLMHKDEVLLLDKDGDATVTNL